MKNSKVAIFLVSTYLLVFTILSRLDTSIFIMHFMFILSPFLMLWMVYSVLRYGKYSGKELGKDQEWGYEDYPGDKY